MQAAVTIRKEETVDYAGDLPLTLPVAPGTDYDYTPKHTWITTAWALYDGPHKCRSGQANKWK
jgi:hypothetical protein